MGRFCKCWLMMVNDGVRVSADVKGDSEYFKYSQILWCGEGRRTQVLSFRMPSSSEVTKEDKEASAAL